MLTKTRKWLTIFVVAFAALVLVACDNKPKEVNPAAIQITFDFIEIEDGVEINGEKVLLSIETTPANAIKTVKWSSSDDKIATVNDKGEVTGLKPGKVKIKATSTVDESLVHEIELTVYENKNPQIVLVNARDEVKNDWTTFIYKDHQFPKVTNPYVKVEYFDVDGNKFTNNVYRYNYEKDALETIMVKLTYMEATLEFPMDIKVVQDANNNEFTAIADAKAQLVAAFDQYNATNKVMADVVFPTEYVIGEGEDAFTVAVSYTTNDAAVLTKAGVYTRPNDDTPVRIEAYFVCGNVSDTYYYTFITNGYTQEEKIEWLQENVTNFAEELKGTNLLLPKTDSKFRTEITWASNKENVLTAAGKLNPFLEEATEVTLTATIKYKGTVDSSYAFTQDYEVKINVLPFENDAQKIAFQFGENLELPGAFYFYFPYGVTDRECGNIIPLPNKIGGDNEDFKDIDVTWESTETGLFNENWELQKQYLRYHEVTLIYSVTVGENTATGEVKVNVGVAKTPDILYFAGRFTSSNNELTGQPYDGLHTISRDDGAAAGSNYEGWSGFTFYTDVENEDGKVIRHQYFADNKYTYKIFEGEGGVTFDEDGNMTGSIKGMTGDKEANYQYMLLLNTTDKDVKIPITYLNYKGSSVKQDINGTTMIRQKAIAFDAWRFGFAADATGKVVYGFGETSIEPAYAAMLAEDENFVYPEYVVIPAGGIGYSPFSTQNKLYMGQVFCEVDTQLVFESYTPKYIPED